MPTREISLQFNESKIFEEEFQLTADAINSIIGALPNRNLSVTLPQPFGTVQLGNLQTLVRDLLTGFGQPKYKIQYTARGDCRNVDAITIDKTHGEYDGPHSAQFNLFGMGITLNIRVNVYPKNGINMYRTSICPNTTNKRRRERLFTVEWILDVTENPGTTTTKSLTKKDHFVVTPCCNPDGTPTQVGMAPGAGAVPAGGAGVAAPTTQGCLACGELRYRVVQIDSEDGKIDAYEFCVTVTNNCANDIPGYVELNRLQEPTPGADLQPIGPPTEIREQQFRARRQHALGESSPNTIVCFTITRKPQSGEMYEVVVGPDITGSPPNHRVNRGSMRNCLAQIRIP